MEKQTDASLLSRLRFIGYSLLVFSLCFFIYAITSSPTEPSSSSLQLPEEELSAFVELSPKDTFNFFAIASVFASLGAVCLVTSKKKQSSIHKKK